jgi:CheY-like chemotaxis protein
VKHSYVLIVDDDPDAREVLTDIVEHLGLQVRVAEDGQAALDIAFGSEPALILLDLMMPRMNGFSTLARLHSMPRTRRIPVIVVSACSTDTRHMLMLPGVTEVVGKGTFTIESMTLLIKRTLNIGGAHLPHISLKVED